MSSPSLGEPSSSSARDGNLGLELGSRARLGSTNDLGLARVGELVHSPKCFYKLISLLALLRFQCGTLWFVKEKQTHYPHFNVELHGGTPYFVKKKKLIIPLFCLHMLL